MRVLRTLTVRWRARLGDDRGSSPVELAIVAPAVLLLIFGAIQACLLFHANNLALAAAQQGVDAERAYNATPGTGTQRASSFLDRGAGDFLRNRSVTVSGDGTTVTVTVRAKALSLIPGWGSVTQTVSGPREIVTGG